MDNPPLENSISNTSPTNAQGLATSMPVDQPHGHPQHPQATFQPPGGVPLEAAVSSGAPRPPAAGPVAMTAMSRFLSSQQTGVGGAPGVPPPNAGPGVGAGMPMDLSQGPPPSRPPPSMMDVDAAFPSSMRSEGTGQERGMNAAPSHIPVPVPVPLSSFRPPQVRWFTQLVPRFLQQQQPAEIHQ